MLLPRTFRILAVMLGLSAVDFAVAQEPVPLETYLPALELFVDDLVAMHQTVLACSDAEPSGVLAQWSIMRETLKATLWANGFPEGFIAAVDSKTSAPPSTPRPPACADTSAMAIADQSVRGWRMRFSQVFTAIGMTVVEIPVTAEQWAAVKALVAEHVSLESQVLACDAMRVPFSLTVAMAAWMEVVYEVRTMLLAAGLPRPGVHALIESADANTLWHRPSDDEVAALEATCTAGGPWDNYARLSTARTLPRDVARLLGQ